MRLPPLTCCSSFCAVRSNLNEGICICDATLKDCPVVYVNNAFLR